MIVDDVILSNSVIVKDLGVFMSSDLKFEHHISKICSKANQKTGILFRSFRCRRVGFLKAMFMSHVRSLLESNTCVWSPYLLGEISKIEKVQRRFTKRIPRLKNLSYKERLEFLKLDTLEKRRLIFDLVQTFKIVRGYDDPCFDTPLIPIHKHKHGILSPN